MSKFWKNAIIVEAAAAGIGLIVGIVLGIKDCDFEPVYLCPLAAMALVAMLAIDIYIVIVIPIIIYDYFKEHHSFNIRQHLKAPYIFWSITIIILAIIAYGVWGKDRFKPVNRAMILDTRTGEVFRAADRISD